MGLFENHANHLRLTEKGLVVSDSIWPYFCSIRYVCFQIELSPHPVSITIRRGAYRRWQSELKSRCAVRVQGVGFPRDYPRDSQEFRVTGFVRNEEDGSVCIVAEGERAEVQAFLDRVQERMHGYIHAFHVHWYDATDRWTSFQIER